MAAASIATSRERHRVRAIVGAAVLAPLALALALSFAVTPEELESGRVVLSPSCTFKQIFGRPCPTCGLTRGFAALSHGHLDDATGYNRGVVLVYALFWIGAATSAVIALHGVHRYRRLTLSARSSAPLSPETLA